jgi:hypothetical protein
LYVRNNGGHPRTLAVPRPLGANPNAAPSSDRGRPGRENGNAPARPQGPGAGAGREGTLNYNAPKSNTGNGGGHPGATGGFSPRGDTTVRGSGVPQGTTHTTPPAHMESQPRSQEQQFQPRSQEQQFQPRSQGQQHDAPASHFTPPAHTESQPRPQGQQFQPRSQGQQHEAPASHSVPKDKDEPKHK